MHRHAGPYQADIVAEANQFPALVAALRLSLQTLENPLATPDEVATTCIHARGVLLNADALHQAIAPKEARFHVALDAHACGGVPAN